MKKPFIYAWALRPTKSFQKSIATLKILFLLLSCELVTSGYSATTEDLKNSTGSLPELISDYQQQFSISGTITDGSTGEAMPGVNIQIKGTIIGTVSDESGKYAISVTDRNAILVISFVGYVTQEVPLAGRTIVDVGLAASLTGLEEVVVIGYGTQKKVSLTSAVSSVSGENLTVRTVANIQQTLQGQLTGLTIIDNGAPPGTTNMTMRIRGITTLSNNNPLVIVDGIEQSLNDINPIDIESVTILKDASSTAIYGSRAANGVVLITTKRAKASKVSVSYNGYYALQKSNNNPEHMGLEDYMRLQNVAWTNSSGSPLYTEEYIQEYLNATDRLKYPLPNTWHKAILHTAPQLNHSLSISGGDKTIQAILSVRYKTEEGIIANTESTLSEFRLNTDYKLAPKIKIETDINYRNKDILTPLNVNKIFNRMLQTSQWTVPKYPDGTYGISSDGHNPLMYAEKEGTRKTNDDYLVGNIKGDWEILKGLKFSTQFGALITYSTGKNYTNSFEVRDYYNPDIVKYKQELNNLTESRNKEWELTINNLLNYSTTLGNHFLNVLAGYSQIEHKVNNLSAFRQDFYNNEIQSISQGANDATKTNSGSESEWGLRSFFGRFNYSFQEKYLFEVNARYDGSSRFVDANRYSFFPSFSAGWRISQEQFWSDLTNIVNELKLRASWGQTGNQAVALYSYIASLSLGGYNFNSASAPGYRVTTLANKDLTWETTTQSNIGLDAQFLQNRISLSIDYYYKRTDGILLTLPVPGTLGLNGSPQNAGIVDNSGLEFILGTINQFGPFGFEGNVNFSTNNNEVIDLAGTGPYISGRETSETCYITGEGYPYNSLWGFKVLGLFQTDEEVANYPKFQPGTKPGDIKYEDLNKDGKITMAGDMTYLGRTFPKYTFGSNLNFSYKNFALNLFMQGVAGVQARIGGAITQMGIWGGFAHKLIANNYWTPDNPNARFSRPLKYDTRNDPAINNSRTDQMSGAYLRLKNIQLNYQIPNSLTKRIGIEQIGIYVSTTNLVTFSELNEWNLDPESVVGGRTEVYPQTSLTTFGLNIRF